MARAFSEGDHGEWGDPEDRTRGTIKRKLTEPYQIKAFTVPASTDDPWFLLETNGTGAEAAHKPEELRKVSSQRWGASGRWSGPRTTGVRLRPACRYSGPAPASGCWRRSRPESPSRGGG